MNVDHMRTIRASLELMDVHEDDVERDESPPTSVSTSVAVPSLRIDGIAATREATVPRAMRLSSSPHANLSEAVSLSAGPRPRRGSSGAGSVKPELQGYLFARKRGSDGLLKRWKARFFIVLKASEDEAIDPHARTIAYFENEEKARRGQVCPRGFVILTEDSRVDVPHRLDSDFSLTLGPLLRRIDERRFFEIRTNNEITDFLAPSVGEAERWRRTLNESVAQLAHPAHKLAHADRTLLEQHEHDLPSDERKSLMLRRSYAKLRSTSMLSKLVKCGSLELVRDSSGDALVESRKTLASLSSSNLSQSTAGLLATSGGVHSSLVDSSLWLYTSDVGKDVFDLRAHIQKLFAQDPSFDRPRSGFDMEFEYVQKHAELMYQSEDFSVARRACNMIKNRYLDVLAPNSTRVILRCEVNNDDHDAEYESAMSDDDALMTPSANVSRRVSTTNAVSNRSTSVQDMCDDEDDDDDDDDGDEDGDGDALMDEEERAESGGAGDGRGAASLRRAAVLTDFEVDSQATKDNEAEDEDEEEGDERLRPMSTGSLPRRSPPPTVANMKSSASHLSTDAYSPSLSRPNATSRDAVEFKSYNNMHARMGDYINANYVDGEWPDDSARRAYIATQGPMQSTSADFWTLVLQQDARVIVMLTKEYENGRRKCARYWPSMQDTRARRYGAVWVRCIDESSEDELLCRRFEIRKVEADDRDDDDDDDDDDEDDDEYEYDDASRHREQLMASSTAAVGSSSDWTVVHHYQYIGWPDHGVPVNTKAFLSLINQVETHRVAHSSPIVCHCSAGIGRTGTFIAVHDIMLRYRAELVAERADASLPPINMVKTVLHLRRMRPGMVQTKEQFMFCYIAIEQLLDDDFHGSDRKLDGVDDDFEGMLRKKSYGGMRGVTAGDEGARSVSKAAATPTDAADKPMSAHRHFVTQSLPATTWEEWPSLDSDLDETVAVDDTSSSDIRSAQHLHRASLRQSNADLRQSDGADKEKKRARTERDDLEAEAAALQSGDTPPVTRQRKIQRSAKADAERNAFSQAIDEVLAEMHGEEEEREEERVAQEEEEEEGDELRGGRSLKGVNFGTSDEDSDEFDGR